MRGFYATRQLGATLVISLIMLVLLMLAVAAGFAISNTNLRSVGNMQSRDEAIAAANMAIEQVISENFINTPEIPSVNIDINNDGSTDYVVDIAEHYCIRAVTTTRDEPLKKSKCSEGFEHEMGTEDCKLIIDPLIDPPPPPPGNYWNTDWIINATAQNEMSGVSASVEVGVRILLTDQEKQDFCRSD
jgi:hypothetical protein